MLINNAAVVIGKSLLNLTMEDIDKYGWVPDYFLERVILTLLCSRAAPLRTPSMRQRTEQKR